MADLDPSYAHPPWSIEERNRRRELRVREVIEKLPSLTKQDPDLNSDDSCPICLVPFETILEDQEATSNIGGEAEMNLEEKEEEDVFDKVELKGVTKLGGCGHVFCMLDLVEWIRGYHGTCPTCRHKFLDIKPPSDSDYESSDGDYIPDDEEDEEDGFFDTDGFTDMEDFEMEDADEEMDFDDDFDGFGASFGRGGLREDEDEGLENLGLSDGYGSESFSEGVSDEGVGVPSGGIDHAVVFDGEGPSGLSRPEPKT